MQVLHGLSVRVASAAGRLPRRRAEGAVDLALRWPRAYRVSVCLHGRFLFPVVHGAHGGPMRGRHAAGVEEPRGRFSTATGRARTRRWRGEGGKGGRPRRAEQLPKQKQQHGQQLQPPPHRALLALSSVVSDHTVCPAHSQLSSACPFFEAESRAAVES